MPGSGARIDRREVRIGLGDVDLRGERLNLQLAGAPKKFRIGVLHTPIELRGTLHHPTVGIKGSQLLAQGAVATVLGAIGTPLAAIAAFVDPGLNRSADCRALLADAKSTGAPLRTAAAKPQNPRRHKKRRRLGTPAFAGHLIGSRRMSEMRTMTESRRANLVSIALATAAMTLVGAVPAYSANAWTSAQDRVSDAVRIVNQMKRNPGLARILENARGVFIIPHFGKGGFIVGAQGGGGVVLAKRHGRWTSPAFYSMAGGSIGAQIGGVGGSVAMILMTNKSLDRFADARAPWSLNGNAGLTVATWSDKVQARTTRDDVIIWTNTEGLYGGLTASLTRMSPDRKMDRAYYGRRVSSHAILAGLISSPSSGPLRDALASRVASAQP